MRKWLGLIITALLIIVFLPAGLGILAKKSLDRLVADLPMPDGATLTMQDYTFGWLNSYVAFKIQAPKTPKNAHYVTGETLDIIIHGDIIHGPFVATTRGMRPGVARVDTHAKLNDLHGLSEKTHQELYLLFKNNDLLHASSLLQILNGITIDLKSSPIQTQLAGDNFQWNGFNAHIKANHDFDKLDTDITISPILFTTQSGATLDAAQGQYKAQLSREEESLWVGEQIFTLPTFYLKDELGAVLRFDHLRIMSTSNIIHELLEASLDIEADNIEVNNQKIEQLRFDVEISDFANKPVLALSKIMHKPQPWSPEDKQQAFKLITQALAPGANVEIDYHLNMQNEQVVLRGKLDFPNIKDTVNPNVAVNAQQLLAGLNAQVEFSAPQPVVSDLLFDMTWSALTRQMGTPPGIEEETQVKQLIDNQVQALVQSGAFVVKDNMYNLDFNYQQGNMLLNAQPVTEGEIFLLLMLLLEVTPDESPLS
ncbi:MAG: DUF945 family protein [Legionellales bacterium]|jgi:uncharacterized protein YdgA (DUF945 family)